MGGVTQVLVREPGSVTRVLVTVLGGMTRVPVDGTGRCDPGPCGWRWAV